MFLRLGLGVKQTLIGARREVVKRDLLIITRYMNQTGNVKARIKVTIDSTVNIRLIVGIKRP